MKMEVFLYRFERDIGFANRCFANAQSLHPELVNDMAFLAAVNQFKQNEGGKKKAMQIQIFFCIPKRGAGAENPYAISPARQNPLPEALETLNRVTITPIKQEIVGLRNRRKEIDRLMGRSTEDGVAAATPLSKLKGGFKNLALKAGTKGREVDVGLFDDIVQLVLQDHSRMYHWVAGYDGEPGILNTADPHVAGFNVLENGNMGANFDLVQMGIY